MIRWIGRVLSWTGAGPMIAGIPEHAVRATLRLPLAWSLRVLALVAWLKRPDSGPMQRIAEAQFGVHAPSFRSWYRQSWWGSAAAKACRLRNHAGRDREILRAMDPVDWAPLDAAAKEGRGLLLSTTHHGVPYGLMAVMETTGRYALRIGFVGERVQHPAMEQGFKLTPTNLPIAFVKAHAHLRSGGIVTVAADGKHRASYVRPLFGRDYRFGTGGARLSHATGAPTLHSFVQWNAYRLSVLFSEPLRPTGVSLAEWTKIWLDSYAEWVEACALLNPPSLRFHRMLNIWEQEDQGRRQEASA